MHYHDLLNVVIDGFLKTEKTEQAQVEKMVDVLDSLLSLTEAKTVNSRENYKYRLKAAKEPGMGTSDLRNTILALCSDLHDGNYNDIPEKFDWNNLVIKCGGRVVKRAGQP